MTDTMNEMLLENGYVKVTELLDSAGDWEWSQSAVVFNPEDGLFYWTTQGGCSCNWFEWPGEGQYAPGFDGRGTKHDAVAFLNGLPVSDDSFGYARNVIDRAVQDVLTFKHAS